jgi:YD repeat-containing protein
MHNSIRGVAGSSATGWRRYLFLGQGPAQRALLASVAAFTAGCGASDAAPDGAEPTIIAHGQARSALVVNSVLEASGDTYVRQLFPNENEGTLTTLSVQTSSRHRTLVFFDTASLLEAVGNGTVLAARIDLFVESNQGGWGAGRAVGIHALRQAATENGATWNCAVDADTQNTLADCSGDNAWNMSAANAALPYASTPTSTAVIANGTLGVVSFDVTPNVLDIMAGNADNHGWLIKKIDETVTGSVRFVSREQGPAPRLTLTINAPDPCTPVASSDVTCDAIDDDCDGTADEDVPPEPTTCGVGACVGTGISRCVAGGFENDCQPGAPPSASDATCDAVDDDCDGVADDDYAPLPTECGIGACQATGATSCVEGAVVDGCTPAPAADADTICDGLDEDCDGAIDEEFEPGCSQTSAVTCVDGQLQASDCSDHDACNGAESCTGEAVCVAGAPPELDDADPCTADACDPALGATHSLLAAGTACGEYLECSVEGACLSILPPDPAQIAPALAAGSVSFLDRVSFLFEGEPRVQSGVASGVIEERSAAVVRGRVLTSSGAPLPQVKVSIVGHPEYGYTESRIDGAYDLVVNGGGPLTLRFERADVLGADRTVAVPWQDYASLDDVALLARDVAVTSLALPTPGPVLHQASSSSDARGTRTTRVFIPSGTGATVVLSDGSTSAASSLSLRATERSAGAAAKLAMAALLPQTALSAYAIELSADEADAVLARRVDLGRPVALHVDNFVDLPVGTVLPFGGYDRQRATWVGASNGRVLALVGVSAGLARLDIDGSGKAATDSALAALGIDAEERAAIAQSHSIGATFMRLSVQRLGAYDVGLPFAVTEGSGGVDPKLPGQLAPLADPTVPAAAPETQVLAQSIPLAGTPFTLEYHSNRVLGDRRGRQLNIPAMGTSVSSGLSGGLVDVQIAGQRHSFSVPPTPSAAVPFAWDGEDIAGRPVHGWQRAEIRVGLVAPRSYRQPSAFANAFAHTSTGSAVGEQAEPNVRWLRYDRMLHTYDSRQTDIGGWALDQHHSYDPKSRVVYLGDGRSYPTRTSSTTIERFAGVAQTGSAGVSSGDGGSALAARMDSPRAIAVGPDGAVYIGTREGVRRVDAETGVMTTVAGGKSTCNPNLIDGVATDMCIFAHTIDFARDGSLIIADNPTATGSVDRIRRLDLATGTISHVAGVRPNAGCTNTGDGGPAREAALCNLTAHASGPDGSIYVLDRGSSQNPEVIRKISTDGTIDRIASGNWSASDDAAALAVGPDGSVYVAQTRSVLRILPSGESRLFAGDGVTTGNSGEGGSALLARFGTGGPSGVFVGLDGRVYIGDTGNAQIRMVDQQGIIRRVAGTSATNVSGNGGSPLLAALGTGVVRAVLGPDGAMFVTARSNHTVRVVRPTIAGDFSGDALVPSLDGTERYRFAADGRHLETTILATGELEYAFGYDDDGRLVEVTDLDGNITTIERDAAGNPTRIIAPGGEETLVDTLDGYVSTFIGPDGAETDMSYATGGLLVRLVDAGGAEHTYAYDADGRLLAP